MEAPQFGYPKLFAKNCQPKNIEVNVLKTLELIGRMDGRTEKTRKIGSLKIFKRRIDKG